LFFVVAESAQVTHTFKRSHPLFDVKRKRGKMAAKSVLVYGGCGALGSAVVTAFKGAAWHVISVDFRVSDVADENITLKGEDLQVDTASVAAALGETSWYHSIARASHYFLWGGGGGFRVWWWVLFFEINNAF
jgi:FlaA1/EpsC-like NDP-sugar epimerase